MSRNIRLRRKVARQHFGYCGIHRNTVILYKAYLTVGYIKETTPRAQNMTSIEEYLNLQEKLMKENFDHIRRSYSDSDVKGGANERIVADFLRKYISCRFVTNNSQIVDSYGYKSRETDVCVCNQDQPLNQEHGGILIAEGIDLVVQVKATLTKQEINSAIDNCKSVKMLKRRTNQKDIFAVMDEDIPYYVDRIPYFVFAFSGGAKFETLCKTINSAIKNVDYIYQPDAFLILNDGFVVNCREGKGVGPKINGEKAKGIFAYSLHQNLSYFMKFIHLVVPRFYRVIDPLTYYLRDIISVEFKPT